MKTDTEYFHEALALFRARPSSRGLVTTPCDELPLATLRAILTEAQYLKEVDIAVNRFLCGTRYLPVDSNG
jgi:hypothetical protein